MDFFWYNCFAMQNTTLSRPTFTRVQEPAPSPLLQGLLALLGGLSLFLILVVAAVVGYDMLYKDRVFPGVTVAGIDLSGMTPVEAAEAIANRLDYPDRGKIAFHEGTTIWTASPKELGLYLDSQASAMAAYETGRQGTPFERLYAQFYAWRSGIDHPPLLVYDERAARDYLAGLSKEIDRPIIEASLKVNGTEVVVTPGQIGRTLDVDDALKRLRAHLPTLTDGLIPLVVHESPPVILDASEQAEIARRILSKPLVLSIPNPEEGDPGPWTFERDSLAKMIDIERVESPEGARYQVGLNTSELRAFLEETAPKLLRYPQNARMIFNDDTRQLEVIQEAVIGRYLDIETSMKEINQKLAAGEHDISLTIVNTNPAVTDDTTAEQLGIRELVSEHTSYFRGSDASRIQNIVTAASRFHGVLVPPGATFSMAEVLGDVSLDAGYAEALIIFGDRTIQGVGGGVCQVSTTLFRTAFLGGYPIVERHPHAYRVGYYEQTSKGRNTDYAGLDATVFVPVVDFKFVNYSSSWLLMETYVNRSSGYLTWKFYSASDGRTVKWETTGLQNIVEPPPPLYEEDPELDEGEIKQIDYEVQGADVTINRTVYKDGNVLFTDTFYTHYLPWRSIYKYGPGTEVPDQDESGE